jgi:MFS family permease
MKKTIWQPLILGTALGLLAGIATVTGLSFLTPGITANAVGFYGTLLLLSAALGGPLAGAIASAVFLVISALFGSPDFKAVITVPAVFWSNLLVVGTILALVGFAYRFIFERWRMPARLLPWVGIVIAYYLLVSPVSITLQNLLVDTASLILPEVLYSYETYIPQAIFDIFITSLIFIALPSRYNRPLWYESTQLPVVRQLNT